MGAGVKSYRLALMGNPSRKVLMRGLAGLLVAQRAERFWLALHGMENATRAKRAAFVEQARKPLSNIRI
jgi:hypothetical protein